MLVRKISDRKYLVNEDVIYAPNQIVAMRRAGLSDVEAALIYNNAPEMSVMEYIKQVNSTEPMEYLKERTE